MSKVRSSHSKKNKGPSGCMMVFFIFVGVLILLLFIGKVSNKKEAPSQTVGSTQVSTDKLKNDVVKEVEVKKNQLQLLTGITNPRKIALLVRLGRFFIIHRKIMLISHSHTTLMVDLYSTWFSAKENKVLMPMS